MPDSDDPEFDALKESYARNREWAKRGSYMTRLSPREEQEFQGWLWKNDIPYDIKWPHDQSMQSYDMRGFYKAMKSGNPLAKTAVDPTDGRIHFPDIWKTPYHETFSNQSIYALPTAPTWDKTNTKLVDKNGNVIFDALKPPT